MCSMLCGLKATTKITRRIFDCSATDRRQSVAGPRQNNFQYDWEIRNLCRIRHRLFVHAGDLSDND